MNLFGKKSAPSAPVAPRSDPIQVIAKLRDNLDTLEKRENFIAKKMENCVMEAKKKVQKGDKKGALFELKRKKMYEKEIDKLQGARVTMDSQIMALESATVNIQTFQAMQSGAQAMKGLRGNIDADKVEDMMDEMEEEKGIHDAISDAISRPGQSMFDDEELMAELNELEELELEESAPVYVPPQKAASAAAATKNYDLPSAPTGAIKGAQPIAASHPQEDEEERALRELQASML